MNNLYILKTPDHPDGDPDKTAVMPENMANTLNKFFGDSNSVHWWKLVYTNVQDIELDNPKKEKEKTQTMKRHNGIDTDNIITELENRRAQVNAAIQALTNGQAPNLRRKAKGKRVMSAAARKAIGDAARKRWAKIKKAQKTETKA